MFANVLRAQQAKSLRSNVLWVEMALLVAFAALITILANTLSEMSASQSSTAGGQVVDVLETAATSTMGGMLAVILAGALMAQEYGWRSLHLWLSRGVSRSTFLITKFLSLLIPVVLFFVAAGLVTTALAVVFADGGFSSVTDHIGDIGFTVVAGVWAVLPYAAMAMLLAVAGQSMLVAIGGGLALTLLAENLLVQLMGIVGGSAVSVVAYLPSVLTQGLLEMDTGTAVEPLSQGVSAGLIGAYTVGLLAIAAVLFRRQDLSD